MCGGSGRTGAPAPSPVTGARSSGGGRRLSRRVKEGLPAGGGTDRGGSAMKGDVPGIFHQLLTFLLTDIHLTL